MSTPLTAEGWLPFTPSSLMPDLAGDEPKIVFYLRIPTWQERDDINYRMYRYGVRSVTQDAVRATMIDQLFKLKGDAAEDDGAFLEGYWTIQQNHETALEEWRDRETQRLADIDAGADPNEEDGQPEPPPEITISTRDRARAQALTQEIIDGSAKVRDVLTDQSLYQRRFAELMARMQIAGWEGLKCEAKFDKDLVLTMESVEALRSELFPLASEAWKELVFEAQIQFAMPRGEEGNSDSPPENTSTEGGSPPVSDGSASSDGASTKTAPDTSSNTGPTPDDELPKAIARSSASTRGSGGRKPRRGPTAAA